MYLGFWSELEGQQPHKNYLKHHIMFDESRFQSRQMLLFLVMAKKPLKIPDFNELPSPSGPKGVSA